MSLFSFNPRRKQAARAREIERLRTERDQLIAQLDVIGEQAAWLAASDDRVELAEASDWKAQQRVLQSVLDELDIRLFALELEAL